VHYKQRILDLFYKWTVVTLFFVYVEIVIIYTDLTKIFQEIFHKAVYCCKESVYNYYIGLNMSPPANSLSWWAGIV